MWIALNHRGTHDDLLSVRDPDLRAKLPMAEQAGWADFWRDLQALRTRVAPKIP